MLRGHVEGKGFMSVSKTRSSWLCKTSQTEKNPNTWHLPYTEKKKKSSKKSKKQEAFQKSHKTVVPSSHLCLMDFLSAYLFQEPHAAQQPHPLPSSVCHNRAVSLSSGSPCLLLQPCDQQSPDKKHTLQLYSSISSPPWQMPQYPDFQLWYNYKCMQVTAAYMVSRSRAFSISYKYRSKNGKHWSRKDVPQKIKRRFRGKESLSKRVTTERAIKTYENDSKRTQQVRDSRR